MELAGRSPLPPRAMPQLDEFAARAAELLQAPVGLVSLVDQHGQNLPGAFGLPEPWRTERWTPLSHSFCQHVVRSGDALNIVNADDEPLVAENAAVMELGVIAYLGVPLVIEEPRTGTEVVGALCAIDHQPRRWTQEQREQLERLAAECSQDLTGMVREQDGDPGNRVS